MKMYIFSLKEMEVVSCKSEYQFRLTSKGGVCVELDSNIKYFGKICNTYKHFFFDGQVIVIFDNDYTVDMDKIHNTFVNLMISYKKNNILTATNRYNEYVEKENMKIKYFESNLKLEK